MKKTIDDLNDFINENNYGLTQMNKSVKQMTSLKIGGLVRLVYYPDSLASLKSVYKEINQKHIPYYIIGNGTNTLFTDSPLDIVLICLKKLNKFEFLSDTELFSEAGCDANYLGYKLAPKGYWNAVLFALIPGTIGGLIYMNASAYQMNIGDYIQEIHFLKPTGEIEIFHEEFNKGYRCSIFHELEGIIVGVIIKLKKAEKIDEPLQKIKRLKTMKKKSQPYKTYNAGSTFKNTINISSWTLIDQIGYRGYKINDAQVSDVHANFLINRKDATFNDMMQLITSIKKQVLKTFNIDLVLEWQLIMKDQFTK